MSDVSLATTSQRRKIVDVVDDTWARDTLSDDEIDVPKDSFENDDDESESDDDY